MALQRSLAVIPPDAQVVSSRLAVLIDDETFVAFSAADPIYTCRVDDHDGMRLAAGMLSRLKLAPDTALAKALAMSRETVRRNRNRLTAGGGEAGRGQRRGPKGPHKLTGAGRGQAQRGVDQGWPVHRVAREVGLTEGALRKAIRQGRLQRRVEPRVGLPARSSFASSSTTRSSSSSRWPSTTLRGRSTFRSRAASAWHWRSTSARATSRWLSTALTGVRRA